MFSSDGEEIGKVVEVLDNYRENIFDGLVIETAKGPRFVDAPEVARIAERAVTLTFPAAESEQHLRETSSRLTGMLRNTKTARRAKRLGGRARDAWERR